MLKYSIPLTNTAVLNPEMHGVHTQAQVVTQQGGRHDADTDEFCWCDGCVTLSNVIVVGFSAIIECFR